MIDDWIRIEHTKPYKGLPVVFKETFNKIYHVGYWNKEENRMDEYPDDREGYHWTADKWTYI